MNGYTILIIILCIALIGCMFFIGYLLDLIGKYAKTITRLQSEDLYAIRTRAYRPAAQNNRHGRCPGGRRQALARPRIPSIKDWATARKSANKRQFRFEEYRDYCQSIDLLPPSHKAWGALARSIARAGLIRKTRFVEPAISAKTHAHGVAVWRIV